MTEKEIKLLQERTEQQHCQHAQLLLGDAKLQRTLQEYEKKIEQQEDELEKQQLLAEQAKAAHEEEVKRNEEEIEKQRVEMLEMGRKQACDGKEAVEAQVAFRKHVEIVPRSRWMRIHICSPLCARFWTRYSEKKAQLTRFSFLLSCATARA